MKKFLCLIIFCFLSGSSQGAYMEGVASINQASFTTSNYTTGLIRGTKAGQVILKGIILSTNTNLNVKVYDSSATATNQIADLYTSTNTYPVLVPFDVKMSSGITLTITGNSQGITIIYMRTDPR